MKIGEAILRRNEITNNIQQLSQRINNNLIVQEGDEPGENPRILLTKLAKEEEALERLTTQIFYTNYHTMCGSVPLSELVTRKKILEMKSQDYARFAERFSQSKAYKSKKLGMTNDEFRKTLSQLTHGNDDEGSNDGIRALKLEMKFIDDVTELQKLETTAKELKEELEALDTQIRLATWENDLIEDASLVTVVSE